MATFITILLIAVSLALDALAVSIAGGLAAPKLRWRDAMKVGLYFGGFQAGMPILGWAIGGVFRGLVMSVSGWIAFILLTILGLKMIKESFDQTSEAPKSLLTAKTLLFMAIATSIDALVVGVTLSLVGLPLAVSVAVIGLVTFGLSVAGFIFGKHLGALFAGKVEVVGGVCLIGIGLKLLLT